MSLIKIDIDDSGNSCCPEAGDCDSIVDEYWPPWNSIAEQYGAEEFSDDLLKRFCDAPLKGVGPGAT